MAGPRPGRRYWITSALEGWIDTAQWPGLQSIGLAECEREINGERTIERRYYLSSLPADAESFGAATRSHWGIENRLHWSLDVTFREDDCRIRKDHGPDNVAMLRHLTLNMLRQETTCKVTSHSHIGYMLSDILVGDFERLKRSPCYRYRTASRSLHFLPALCSALQARAKYLS